MRNTTYTQDNRAMTTKIHYNTEYVVVMASDSRNSDGRAVRQFLWRALCILTKHIIDDYAVVARASHRGPAKPCIDSMGLSDEKASDRTRRCDPFLKFAVNTLFCLHPPLFRC